MRDDVIPPAFELDRRFESVVIALKGLRRSWGIVTEAEPLA
jgi:hypothetical protein